MLRQNRTRIYNTIFGFYQYDKELFKNLVTPNGLNKDLLINEILIHAGMLETSYTDGDLLKELIGVWSSARVVDWERLQDALYAEYIPIHNYDKHSNINNTGTSSIESGTVENVVTGKQSRTDDNNTRTDNLTEKTDGITTVSYGSVETRTDNLQESHGGGETVTHENTAYNAGLTATSRDITQRNNDIVNNTGTQRNDHTGADTTTEDTTKRNTGTQTDNRDITVNENGTENKSITDNSLKNDNNNTNEYTFGNVGVTTTQKLITEEIELRMKYNIYELIANEFKEKFCNLIYAL